LILRGRLLLIKTFRKYLIWNAARGEPLTVAGAELIINGVIGNA